MDISYKPVLTSVSFSGIDMCATKQNSKWNLPKQNILRPIKHGLSTYPLVNWMMHRRGTVNENAKVYYRFCQGFMEWLLTKETIDWSRWSIAGYTGSPQIPNLNTYARASFTAIYGYMPAMSSAAYVQSERGGPVLWEQRTSALEFNSNLTKASSTLHSVVDLRRWYIAVHVPNVKMPVVPGNG